MQIKRKIGWCCGLFVFSLLPSKAQETFQKSFGSTGMDSGRDVEICADGGYITTGVTSSYGAGSYDAWVIKVNSSGEKVWTKTIGGSGDDGSHSINRTTNGNYIIGGYTGSKGMGNEDMYLIKIDDNGNVIWDKTYGGFGTDVGREAIETSDGGYALIGYSNSSPAQYFDVLLIRTDSDGNELWRKRYGGGAFDNGYSLKQTADGGFIILGKTYSYGNGDSDAFLVKTDASGNQLWYKTFGGTDEEEGQYVELTDDGGYIFTADAKSNSAGDFDVMVTKTDGSGNQQWMKMFGGSEKDVAKTIRKTSDDGYIIAAISRSFGLPNPDYWLIKISSNGTKAWDKFYGGANHEHAYSAKQTSDGGYIVTGHASSFNIGNYEDVWLLKVNSSGVVSVDEKLLSNNNLQITPNPATDYIQLSLKDGLNKNLTLELFDVKGQLMLTENIIAHTSNASVSLGNFSKGVYFIKLTTIDETFTEMLVLY